MMVIILALILILIIWMVYWWAGGPKEGGDLQAMGNRVAQFSGYQLPTYYIRDSKIGKSRTIFRTGHHPVIEIWFGDHNDDTIKMVFLHELSHVISKEPNHGPQFYKIEDDLRQTAITLGYLDPKSQIEHDYPCILEH
jgi:hypothetical protein